MSGLAMVGAGLLLQHVQTTWRLFTAAPEILMLVPTLLGLKGNLEMTLASRISTLVHTFLT
jgi:solute carrier family 41